MGRRVVSESKQAYVFVLSFSFAGLLIEVSLIVATWSDSCWVGVAREAPLATGGQKESMPVVDSAGISCL